MIAWLVAAAFAQEVVVVERRVAEAKEGIHRTLKDQGYVKLLRLGERSWYLNWKVWKPGVMVHEQGFARVRGHPVTPLPIPLLSDTEDGTPTAGAAFLWQEPGKVRSQKRAVVERIEPWLRELSDGHWRLAQAQRRLDLQVELSTIWLDDDEPPQLRREALVQRWRDTAPDEGGAWAREQIEAFVQAEVQTSDHPFSDAELVALFGS